MGRHVCMHLLVPGKTNYRVMNDALALVAAGYSVTIVDVVPTLAGAGQEIFEGIHFKHVMSRSWFVPNCWKPWFLSKAFLIIIRCTWVLLMTRADIYHAHVEHAFCAAFIAASFYRSRLIFDTPELTMTGPGIVRWPRFRAIAIRLIRFLAARCDMHITGSPEYVPVLRELYGDRQYLVVRHMPPYREVRHGDLFHQRLDLPATVRIALYQGYLLPDRGLLTLVHTAAYLTQDIVIVLLGQSFGAMERSVQEMIAKNGVADRIKILPAVPYAELLEWTASADLGLLLLPPDYSLSIRKCLPNKFFEYIMAGLPILASNLDAIVPLINGYQLGLVQEELVPERIAASINHLLADQERIASIRAHVLHVGHERGWCWEHEQRGLVEAYHALLS